MHKLSSPSPVTPDSGIKPSHPASAITTETLFRGRHEIFISHNGEQYRLRITKNGKLILTK